MRKNILKFYGITGWITFTSIIVADILTIKFPIIGNLGVFFWYLSYFYIFVLAIFGLAKILYYSYKKGMFFSLLVISLILLVTLSYISSPKNLSGETTQEITCILNHLKYSPDRGFRQTCHLGYPARQFYLTSVPSFFGRSLYLLNLGGSLYFVLGIVIFSLGVISLYQYTKRGDLVNSLLLAMLFHSYHLLYIFSYFEQAFYPFSITLISSGFFMFYLKNRNHYFVFIWGILLLYLVHSYTPSLSVFLLLIGTIFYISVKSQSIKEKLLLLLVILLSLLSFYLSLSFRSDIRLKNNSTVTIQTVAEKLLETINFLLFQNNQKEYFISRYLYFPFFFIILSSLFFIFGWQYFSISIWILGTIIISVLAPGYAKPPPSFAIHRAIIILPVFWVMVATLLNRVNFEKNISRIIVFLSTIIFLVTGYYNQRNFLKSKIRDNYSLFWESISPLVKPYDKQEKLFVTEEIKNNLLSFYDFSQYFFPNLEISNLDLDSNCKIDQKGIIALVQDHPCYYALTQGNNNSYNKILGYFYPLGLKEVILNTGLKITILKNE